MTNLIFFTAIASFTITTTTTTSITTTTIAGTVARTRALFNS